MSGERRPNNLMRGARIARRSPTGSGRAMSRQELADAVSAHLYATTGRVFNLDDRYIGNLERGVTRWPQAPVRAALRAVLDAETDAELGLYINRRQQLDMPPGEAPGRADGVAPELDRHAQRSAPSVVPAESSDIGGPVPSMLLVVSPGTSVTVVCGDGASSGAPIQILVQPHDVPASAGVAPARERLATVTPIRRRLSSAS